MKTPPPSSCLSSCWYYLAISADISHLKEYETQVEAFLKRKASRALSQKRRLFHAPSLPSGANGYWATHYDDILKKSAEAFPQALRQSLFIATCTLLEGHLKTIAEFVRKEQASRNVLKKEDKMSWVESSHRYIQSITGLPLAAASSILPELLFLNRLRNIFVHDMGYIRKTNKKFAKWLQTKRHITLDSSKAVVLGRGFCPEFLSVVDQYLEHLNRDLEERMKHRTWACT